MDQLMFALMAWISAATGLPPAQDLPELVFNTPAELQMLHYPGAVYREGDGVPQAVALYNLEEGVIHLTDDWEVRDPVDLSVLLHELVHHMQASADIDYDCRGAMEKVAYDAQIDFLASMDLDMFEVMEINRLFYVLLTSCTLDGNQ